MRKNKEYITKSFDIELPKKQLWRPKAKLNPNQPKLRVSQNQSQRNKSEELESIQYLHIFSYTIFFITNKIPRYFLLIMSKQVYF